MKRIIAVLIPILVLSSCKQEAEPLSEDFRAVVNLGRGPEIKLADSLFMETSEFKTILFMYHDTVFKVEFDEQDNEHFSILKSYGRVKDNLLSLFKPYEKNTFKEQLTYIHKHGMPNGCFQKVTS